ncbi:MAG: transglycosylase domain-containing protein, partial [Bdellovibrio sp.]|nr:transglycosylase domain-containing protein [Bdellovibrio sp.]
MLKKLLIGFSAFILLVCASLYVVLLSVQKSLPDIIKVEDYNPLLVSQVYDRNNKKYGEFFHERRVLVPYKDIPKHVINAFLAAEDDQFFQHKGINPQALLRAAIANMKAGRNVQGGSTITQQVAKTLLIGSNEKTFSRKLRDILLAIQMEKNLSKDEILYLYLNQIYFGQGAYGIEMAAQTYFKKSTKQLTVPEAAMLAGLPKAPSDYSPVKNPSRSKERQIYVLHRMAEVNFISKDEAEAGIKQPLVVNLREDYEQMAPFYLETVRQLLIHQLGEEVILDQGVKVYTSLDLEDQKAANLAVVKGLKELDRRQGFRGPLSTLDDDAKITEFLEKEKKKLISASNPERTILPDGTFAEIEWHPSKKPKKDAKVYQQEKLPSFVSVGLTYEGVVLNVNDAAGYVEVQVPEGKGIIDFDTMTWARKPNFERRSDSDQIKRPSQALKKGDVILVKLIAEDFEWSKVKATKKGIELPDAKPFLALELDQEPLVEGSLLSIDQ